MIRTRTFAEDGAGGSAATAEAPSPGENAITRAVESARATEAETNPPPPRNVGGRPRGRKDSQPRKRPGASSSSSSAPPPAPEPPPEPSAAELAAMALAWGVVWRLIAAKTGRVRLLTDEEAGELAKATAPVLAKYASGWEEWGPEIGLGLAVIGVVQLTLIEPPAPAPETAPNEHGSQATVVG